MLRRIVQRRTLLCFGVFYAAWFRHDAAAFFISESRRMPQVLDMFMPDYSYRDRSRRWYPAPASSIQSRATINLGQSLRSSTVAKMGASSVPEYDNNSGEMAAYIKQASRQSISRRSSSSTSFQSESPQSIRGRIPDEKKVEWLQQATDHFVNGTTAGSLTEGKWHEVVSLLNAWSGYQKSHCQAALNMEALLKVLVEERRAGNARVEITIDLYNKLLDAWACAAHFRTIADPTQASQRAREILVTLQENYEQHLLSTPALSSVALQLRPDAESFRIVLHLVSRTEGAWSARRCLAWMEYLAKAGKNVNAAPSRSQYIQVLDAYARLQTPRAGILAEAFLRHMQFVQQSVDTLCYNIAIKAWTKGISGRNRREAAEHADRILEEMKTSENAQPDVVTYACKWSIELLP